jgi:hypothetical protein
MHWMMILVFATSTGATSTVVDNFPSEVSCDHVRDSAVLQMRNQANSLFFDDYGVCIPRDN